MTAIPSLVRRFNGSVFFLFWERGDVAELSVKGRNSGLVFLVVQSLRLVARLTVVVLRSTLAILSKRIYRKRAWVQRTGFCFYMGGIPDCVVIEVS